MTFGTYEASRQDGSPVQAFLFRSGTEAGEYHAYTDHTDELVIDHGGALGEITYAPVPISRDRISTNGTLDKSAIRINTDMGTDLAEIFRVYPPANVVNLTIWQGHIDDGDSEFLVVWAGRVVAAGRDRGELVLSGEPVSTSMRRPGLRRHYQIGCPHQLYGPKCQADKEAATVSSTVAVVSGALVTLAPGWEGAFAPAKFLRGMVEWESATGSIERRTIIRIMGDVLSLSGIANGLAVSDPIDVVLGCNHQLDDCKDLHDNVPNYGGQWLIPLTNPIGSFNNYY